MPKVVNHEERKQLIITTSGNIIAEHGFENLTIRALAHSLDISTGMITHYFNNKDDILFAALKGVHSRFFQRVESAIGDSIGLDAIRYRMQASIPLTKPVQHDWRLIFEFWGKATHVPEFSRFMKDERKKISKQDIYHLKAAQKKGELSAQIDIDRAFTQIDAITTGLGVISVFNRSNSSKKQAYAIIEDTLDQFRLSP